MKFPRLNNLDLAYETGFHIGDGTMTYRKNKNEYCIAYYGHKEEKGFYEKIILPLIWKLFGIRMKVKTFENTIYARKYSKKLLIFKSLLVGLPIGKKDSLVSLPEIFLEKPLRYSKQLIAGIFDSDGSVKFVKRKGGIYPRLNFTLKNKGIIEQIGQILLNLEITNTIYEDRSFDQRVNKVTPTWRLDINGYNNLRKFIKSIPIRNFHHLRKIDSFLEPKITAIT